jgi:NAD(P)-dependent dehydrogenase (short-subunit alcohol dehydrogenase family)
MTKRRGWGPGATKNVGPRATGKKWTAHAVVTGGGRGLGLAIAEALARAGMDVTLMGRTRSTLEARASELARETGRRVQAIVCDVARIDDVKAAFARAAASGPVTILVNNAGQSDAADFQDVSLESWSRLIAVNLTGTFLCTQQVLPAMVARGSGRIINIASVAGLQGYAKTAPYCASKHGVVGLTRALAIEMAKSGVTVNAVCPGYIDDTDMFDTAIRNVMQSTGRSAADARATLTKGSPRGTLVTAAEVAATVLWLCSETASAINGQAVAVDAGETAR